MGEVNDRRIKLPSNVYIISDRRLLRHLIPPELRAKRIQSDQNKFNVYFLISSSNFAVCN